MSPADRAHHRTRALIGIVERMHCDSFPAIAPDRMPSLQATDPVQRQFRKHLRSVFWMVLLWWTAYALVFATQVISMGEEQGHPVSWAEALRFSFGGWMTWIPLSLMLYWLVLRFPIERGRILRSAPILMAGVLAVILLRAIYVHVTNPLFGWYEVLPDFGSVLVASIRNNLMLGLTVVGVAHALVFHRQARERETKVAELEASLAKSRLDALRAQLNPHFLFNALNSVAEMVHQDAEIADRMLISLSALLRDGLSAEQGQMRPLRDEISLIEHYLTIEKIRLGKRLKIRWEVEDHCADLPVPVLTLQPLIENAIVHGIARQREPGLLVISVKREASALVMDVENSFDTRTTAKSGTGIGLRSIRDRLLLIYGETAWLKQLDSGAGRFAIQLRIPAPPAEQTLPYAARMAELA